MKLLLCCRKDNKKSSILFSMLMASASVSTPQNSGVYSGLLKRCRILQRTQRQMGKKRHTQTHKHTYAQVAVQAIEALFGNQQVAGSRSDSPDHVFELLQIAGLHGSLHYQCINVWLNEWKKHFYTVESLVTNSGNDLLTQNKRLNKTKLMGFRIVNLNEL